MPKPKIEITSEIAKEYALSTGATVAGIAAASDFTSAPDGHKPTDVLEGCRSVIVLGVPFPPEALSLPAPEYTAMRNEYIAKLTAIAKALEKRIRADGHKAKAISAAGGKQVDGKYCGAISLKHAAELTGLGVITRNYLLTSPEHGNLLWLSAVLTDAELTPDEKIQLNICDNCNLCVEICPSDALDNPADFGRKKCDQFFKIVDKKLEIQCHACRTVCPYCFGEKGLV